MSYHDAILFRTEKTAAAIWSSTCLPPRSQIIQVKRCKATATADLAFESTGDHGMLLERVLHHDPAANSVSAMLDRIDACHVTRYV
jgi:hypothetical protein